MRKDVIWGDVRKGGYTSKRVDLEVTRGHAMSKINEKMSKMSKQRSKFDLLKKG